MKQGGLPISIARSSNRFTRSDFPLMRPRCWNARKTGPTISDVLAECDREFGR